MNAPDDMKRELPREAVPKAQIAKDAERARRNVGRRFPGEMGKSETDKGKGFWAQLGIGKDKK